MDVEATKEKERRRTLRNENSERPPDQPKQSQNSGFSVTSTAPTTGPGGSMSSTMPTPFMLPEPKCRGDVDV